MNQFSRSVAAGCESLLVLVACQIENQTSAAVAYFCSVRRACLVTAPPGYYKCYLMYYWGRQSTRSNYWTGGIDECDGFSEIVAKNGFARGYSGSFAAASGISLAPKANDLVSHI